MMDVYDFASNSNLFKKFEVNDLLFVEYKCLFPENKVAYWTSSNYFIYVLGGCKRYVSGNNEYLFKPGEGIFIKRGVYVAERFDSEDFCALVIFVPDSFIESVTRKYAGLHPRKQQPVAGDSIIRMNMDEAFALYFRSVLSYFLKPVSPPGELLVIKFEELIVNILTSPDNDELSAYLLSIKKNDKVCIRETMEKYFMHPLSLNEYARLCARSLSSFKADFFDTFKTSPGKWLMTKRLEHARLLIETTEVPISEIVAKAGFRNTSHFVRIFKDTYGKPPLQYRQGRLQTPYRNAV
jgi:AraC family transcriptional regulator, exoenzyme S synthesis regulatory protein ExsA